MDYKTVIVTNVLESNLWQGWCWQQCGSGKERWHGANCCCPSCGCSAGSDGEAGSQSERAGVHPDKRRHAIILENSTVKKTSIIQLRLKNRKIFNVLWHLWVLSKNGINELDIFKTMNECRLPWDFQCAFSKAFKCLQLHLDLRSEIFWNNLKSNTFNRLQQVKQYSLLPLSVWHIQPD